MPKTQVVEPGQIAWGLEPDRCKAREMIVACLDGQSSEYDPKAYDGSEPLSEANEAIAGHVLEYARSLLGLDN